MQFLSPLRYPGGKRRLSNFLKLVYQYNGLFGGDYIEPYAGGASVALALLYDEYVCKIYINDLDKAIYAFWYCVLNFTDDLCRLINDTPVSMNVWHTQKQIVNDNDPSLLDLGFAAFFLNRTNRSGIMSGGVIGGKDQLGRWKLDARYNKKNLIERIRKVARYRDRIHLFNLDALDFIKNENTNVSNKTLIYLDPPYYVKGKQLLYANYYETKDHQDIAKLLRSTRKGWILSYDDVPEIREFYDGMKYLEYSLNYSVQDRYKGSEIMFFSQTLEIPVIKDPVNFDRKMLYQYRHIIH